MRRSGLWRLAASSIPFLSLSPRRSPGDDRTQAAARVVAAVSEKVPVEVRLWLPDGTTLRIRSFLSELSVNTDAGTIPADLLRYVPVSKWYTLRMEGSAWKKGRDGRPKR